MANPIVLRGLRRDTLGVLWSLREDSLWESTYDGNVRSLADLEDGPYGPTRAVTVVGGPIADTADRAREVFELAERLAPRPETRNAAVSDWARHYAALALAAQAVFRDTLPAIPRNPVKGSRPDLGYLVTIAVSATAAAVGLTTDPAEVAAKLWNLTSEAGNLNGEDIDWLADTLDRLGVNPADLYRWFDAADFKSPTAAGREVS